MRCRAASPVLPRFAVIDEARESEGLDAALWVDSTPSTVLDILLQRL